MSWLVLVIFRALAIWYRILPRAFHLRSQSALAFLLSKISFSSIERNLNVIDRYRVSRGEPPLNKSDVRFKFWYYQLKNLMDFMIFLVNDQPGVEDLVKWACGEEILHRAYSDGNGIVGVCLHMGNWELGGRSLTDKGYELNSLVFEQLNPALDNFISKARINSKIKLLHQRRGIRKAVKMLQKGEIVTVLCDQDGTRAGHFTNFFNLPLSLPRVFELFLSKSNARVVPLIMLHTKDTYEIHVLDEWPVNRENWNEWLQDFYQNLSHHLEDWISKYPEQWLLIYDRFKFRHEQKWLEEGNLQEVKAHYQNIWKGIG